MNADNPTEPASDPWPPCLKGTVACPAQAAPQDAPKSSDSGTSQGNEQHTFSPEELEILRTVVWEVVVAPLLQAIGPMLEAWTQQVFAINRLAASNEALVQAMAAEEQVDETSLSSYLDGKPATL